MTPFVRPLRAGADQRKGERGRFGDMVTVPQRSVTKLQNSAKKYTTTFQYQTMSEGPSKGRPVGQVCRYIEVLA